MDLIDQNKIISGRFYKKDCLPDKLGVPQIKPMELITKDLKKLIVIEDSILIKEKYPSKLE